MTLADSANDISGTANNVMSDDNAQEKPILTLFFSSFTGFLLSAGLTLKLLTILFKILYITRSLHIYISSCAFTLQLVP